MGDWGGGRGPRGPPSKYAPAGIIPSVRYGFLLVCCSNIVPKTRRFQIFDFRKCHDLEIWVRASEVT